MSNETMLPGKGNPVEMTEMQADDMFSYTPPGYGVKRSPIERMIDELAEHFVKTGNTLEQEYQLVQAKKSHLSKRMREFVELAYQMESLKEKDGKELIEPTNKQPNKNAKKTKSGAKSASTETIQPVEVASSNLEG